MRKTFSWITRPMTLVMLFAAASIYLAACAKENSFNPPKETGHGNVDTTGTGGTKDTTTTGGGTKDTTTTGGGGSVGNFAQMPAGISVQTLGRAAPAINKQYVLYTPSTYNTEKSKSWPVIIFLHGIGERGSNITAVKNVALPRKLAGEKDFQFVMIAPQCSADEWWDIPSLNALYAEVLEKYNVDPSRVYLTGLSMGGYGAWNWSMKAAEKFAAVAPICGGADYPDLVCNLKSKPVWVFHNANDPTVGVENSRNLVAALKKCGSTSVTYTENATGGHDAWTKLTTHQSCIRMLKYRK
ncbi:hypothetical protein MKQ70_33355 [Chitinophaga sedimenti]|uniref:carboxylesterase family protein n=1 Tax=Chitinophaga sedimenti TaxID=2033606 RepID=UPI0020053870|nr:hypothetical protein [Chitinophaga sedimenti]MCK7559576.1 hypothetical protein [Chitinophaga sedimenti]